MTSREVSSRRKTRNHYVTQVISASLHSFVLGPTDRAESQTSQPICVQSGFDLEGQNTCTGCRVLIPALEAMAPVMNGTAAAPVAASPAMSPMEPVKSQGGNTRPAWFTAIGNLISAR